MNAQTTLGHRLVRSILGRSALGRIWVIDPETIEIGAIVHDRITFRGTLH